MPERRRPTQMQLPLPADARTTDMNTSTLVPGFLVGLSTSVSGNVQYNKEIIEEERRSRDGSVRSSWQTEKIVNDPEEHRKANQARMKARAIICGTCAKSAFGLLCPESEIEKLKLAIRDARRTVDTFNRTSRLTRVSVYVITGRIARDDVEAARAIKSEVRELMRVMSEGIQSLDPKAVRDAANKLRNVGAMLSPQAQESIKGTIEAARKSARKITKAGETAAQEIDRETITAITQARTAFLDTDEAAEMGEVVHEARAVDLDPEAVEDNDTANDNAVQEEPREVAGAITGRTPAKRPATSQRPKKGAAKRPAARKTAAPAKRRARA